MKTDNELIAEFMGLKPERWRLTPLHKYRVYWCLSSGIGVVGDMLKYNTSWDWLMPVVEKIKVISIGMQEHLKGESYLPNIDRAITAPDIKLTYEEVIEFIKWYIKER